MASASTKVAKTKTILAPSMTLKGHGDVIGSISYFPDGQRMISGSDDKTVRQWDLEEVKEIEEVRYVCEGKLQVVAVSSDSRWVVTAAGNWPDAVTVATELNVFEVKTGGRKELQGHSQIINCIDISADDTLLASGSLDETVRIWNLETGKLVAGPFESADVVCSVRFSTDSKKLAVDLWAGKCLEVWDVQSQNLVRRIGPGNLFVRSMEDDVIDNGSPNPFPPILWTNNNKNILATFSFTEDGYAKTIYEFDASTLETVGTPFEGHTEDVRGLALSFDGALLASSSLDYTIKLWAFESRQLLASFDVHNPEVLILSPDSRKLAFTTSTRVLSGTKDHRICICDTPPDILAQARTIARKKRIQSDLLNSDATRRPAPGHRRPPIHALPMAQRPPPTIDPRQPVFLRLSKLLRFSHTNPVHHTRPRDPLDFPATLPLPLSRTRANTPPSPPLSAGRTFFNHVRSSSVKGKQKARESQRNTASTVNVPLGQATYADVVGVDDGERPYVLFFCLSWFQKKKKKEVPQPPVYDDELEDDEEEVEVVPAPAAVPPPRIQHEDIELKTLANHSQPQAGPSRLAVAAEHLGAQPS